MKGARKDRDELDRLVALEISTPSERPLASRSVVPIANAARSVGESAFDEADRLRRELEEARSSGALVVELAPDELVESAFRDRDEAAFEGRAFDDLVRSIQAQGQLTPSLVRPHPTKPGLHEIVCGHRRSRACRTLGLPVRSIIRNLSDRESVIVMEVENARRKDLSAMERARQYRRLAELGIMSYEQIGAEFGVTKGLIGMLIGISQIPDALVDAIGVLDVSMRQWQKLQRALRDPDVRENAMNLAPTLKGSKVSPAARIDLMCKAPGQNSPPKGLNEALRDSSGEVYARINARNGKASIILDHDAGGFAEFVWSHIPELRQRFRGEGETS